MEIKKIKTKKREITLMCVIAMVMILFLSGCSIGKALASTQIKTTGSIAEPVLIVENGSEIKLTATQNEGNYTFAVKNYDETGKINQVNMKYHIEILSKKDDAITIKLLKNNQEISMKNNITEEFLLQKQTRQKDEYKIEIKYDKNKSTSIEDIIQDIQIKVHSEQTKA